MSINTLHVTNGDSVLYSWKKAGLLGTHMAWKDVLHEGPVPAGLQLEELSRIRADYIAQRGYASGIKAHRDFEKRDALLRRAGEFEEVVLWFEHDLYDQLQLLQILASLHEQGLGAGGVQLVQSEQYLGTMAPEELLALYPRRKFVTKGIADAAARAWKAFTAPQPELLASAAGAEYPGLPFMRDALRRLREEYPAKDTGLSRSEKQLLEACAQGARRKEDLFRKAQAREEAAFMGDASAYALVADLCAEPAPLLTQLEGGYELTVLGRRVLAGDFDWLEQEPLDRWIGGVHLTNARRWRWDETAEAFVEEQQQTHEAQ